VVSFLQVSPPKPHICLSSPPYALHAPPIPFVSWDTKYNQLGYKIWSVGIQNIKKIEINFPESRLASNSIILISCTSSGVFVFVARQP
jgi:hypothetical protein